jgi:hypothetical protein
MTHHVDQRGAQQQLPKQVRKTEATLANENFIFESMEKGYQKK